MSTVHPPDDPRIREKLIRTLAGSATVIYACRTPGPSDQSGVTWHALGGPRWRRNLAAWWLALTGRYEILSLHDPELIPMGWLVALIRRKRVIFDVHEAIPSQILTKAWLPKPARPLVAAAARIALRVTERMHDVSLAEAGYGGLFRNAHPVFPNYLPEGLPAVREVRQGYAVYVGDVTEERGVVDFARAAASVGLPVRIVGRVRPGVEAKLVATGAELLGWLPHTDALEVMAAAVVGVSPLRDLPNYRHSLPTKILEYLAMGVPVVATDLPGTRSAVEGLGPVEFVKAGEHKALADALRRAPAFLEDAKLAAPNIRAAFRWPSEEVRSFYLG